MHLLWQEKYLDEEHSLFIWKQHHSWSDGASAISFILSLSDDYDTSNLIPIKRISFWNKLLLRLLIPYYTPILFFKFLFKQTKTNYLLHNPRVLTGHKLVSTSSDFLLKDVKKCASKLKMSINDLITSCLSHGVRRYLKEKGDSETKDIDIVIPANIRFEHYESIQKIQIENKLSVVALQIPLCDTVSEALKEIPQTT